MRSAPLVMLAFSVALTLGVGTTWADITAEPTNIPSGGTTQLGSPASVFCGTYWSPVGSWEWTDSGAGGTFWPSTSAQNPTWTAPGNQTGDAIQHRLSVRMEACSGEISGGVYVWEAPAPVVPHTLTVTASADPTTIPSGGTSQLSATAIDSQGHNIASWSWAGYNPGTLSHPTTPNPLYTAPLNTTGSNIAANLTVTAWCDGPETASDSDTVTLIIQPATEPVQHFSDVSADYWAFEEIEACRAAGIVLGYSDGTYQPEIFVTRAQMAVYIARAFGLVTP